MLSPAIFVQELQASRQETTNMPLFQNEGIVKMAITVRVYPAGMWPGGTHYHVVEKLGIEGGFEVKLYKGMGGIPPDYRVFAFPPPTAFPLTSPTRDPDS